MKGIDAENRAAAYLERRGLALAARNYRCRYGEIDLIMFDGETLVFVEVRMRTSEVFGGAAASITASKQAKLIRTAHHYLSSIHHEPACRFDVVLMTGTDSLKIEWIKNAFGE